MSEIDAGRVWEEAWKRLVEWEEQGEILKREEQTAREILYRKLELSQVSGTSLTAREQGVLVLVLKKLTNKEIAEKLFISERTVKFHVSAMLKKSGLKKRYELKADSFNDKKIGSFVPVDFSDYSLRATQCPTKLDSSGSGKRPGSELQRVPGNAKWHVR